MECHYVMIATRAGEAAGRRRKLSSQRKFKLLCNPQNSLTERERKSRQDKFTTKKSVQKGVSVGDTLKGEQNFKNKAEKGFLLSLSRRNNPNSGPLLTPLSMIQNQ